MEQERHASKHSCDVVTVSHAVINPPGLVLNLSVVYNLCNNSLAHPLFLSKLDDPHGVSRAIALSESNEGGSLLRLFAKSAEIGTNRGRGARARRD